MKDKEKKKEVLNQAVLLGLGYVLFQLTRRDKIEKIHSRRLRNLSIKASILRMELEAMFWRCLTVLVILITIRFWTPLIFG